MSAVAQLQPSRRPENRPVTLAMRAALGLLHTGALYRDANGNWRARAFPGEPVREATMRGLVERGLAQIQEYEGLHGLRRACATITYAGMRLYRGGRLAARQPPPVAAEAVLHEVEQALAILDAESERLRAELLQDSAAVRDARRGIAEIEARIATAEKRLAERERARESLNARRVDLRALVAHACERLGAELMEAGR